MSHNKRHGTAEIQLRHIPKLPRLDVDATMVDIRPAPARRAERSIPSIARPANRAPDDVVAPAKVIPFTKPRAIAALAASRPDSVVIADSRGNAPPPSTTATRVATGWTPPGAVPNVKPAPPVTQMAATVFPSATAAPVPAPVIAPTAIPVPPLHSQAVQPSYSPAFAQTIMGTGSPLPAAPAVTSRPASQLQAEPAATPKKWAVFEQLGLGMPKVSSQQAAKLVVSAYRLLGFAILTIIVVVLVGYLVSTAFFYVSDSWVVPMTVSPTDEKVVALQAQLAEQQNSRDRIADELAQAERTIKAQQGFQAEFARAIKSDLGGRKQALSRIRALADAAGATRAAIRAQSAAYAAASRRRMSDEYRAGLIDRNTMLSGKFQIAQITSSNLSLAERQAEFQTRAQELEDQTRSLEAVLAGEAGEETALSYEVLRIKQEYEASRLDLAKSVEARDTLAASLARQDKIVKALKQSSYLRAIEDAASVAFVPYGNLANVDPGTGVYACRIGMVICRKVGEVLEVLPGEVQFKHPQRDRTMRGQMVELKLDADEPGAAEDDVLFVGGKPLLF